MDVRVDTKYGDIPELLYTNVDVGEVLSESVSNCVMISQDVLAKL